MTADEQARYAGTIIFKDEKIMGTKLPESFSKIFLKIYHIVEAILLVAITLATLFAIGNEFLHVFTEQSVLLTDILLMFIYLEVLSMVQQFVTNGKIPVRYPIYIAIMAIARYITLGMKELDGVFVVWLSLSALILAIATIVIRVGHYFWPYETIAKRCHPLDKKRAEQENREERE